MIRFHPLSVSSAIAARIPVLLFDIYTPRVYNKGMICTFADKKKKKVFHQIFSRKLPNDIQRVALHKLIMIDNADSLEDLKVPPANHLEQLHGDREGQYSIRVNDQYRICFLVKGRNDFLQVEIADYR